MNNERVICQECEKAGKASRVYPGVSMTTDMYFRPYYDEDGRLHDHDGNTSTTSYSCSNGHEWSKSRTGRCWCGWPENKGKT